MVVVSLTCHDQNLKWYYQTIWWLTERRQTAKLLDATSISRLSPNVLLTQTALPRWTATLRRCIKNIIWQVAPALCAVPAWFWYTAFLTAAFPQSPLPSRPHSRLPSTNPLTLPWLSYTSFFAFFNDRLKKLCEFSTNLCTITMLVIYYTGSFHTGRTVTFTPSWPEKHIIFRTKIDKEVVIKSFIYTTNGTFNSHFIYTANDCCLLIHPEDNQHYTPKVCGVYSHTMYNILVIPINFCAVVIACTITTQCCAICSRNATFGPPYVAAFKQVPIPVFKLNNLYLVIQRFV